MLEARVGLGWYVRAFDVSTAASIFARSLTYHPRVLLADLLVVWSAVEGGHRPDAGGHALTERDFEILGEARFDRMSWRGIARRAVLLRGCGEPSSI